MEFQFKKNVKVVADFEIGEKILVVGYGHQLDGEHSIINMKPNFGGCESGIMVKLSGHDSWFDLGWINKIEKN